ncbi:uncharacterized protein RCH25_036192 [Pelodytes ibericus]
MRNSVLARAQAQLSGKRVPVKPKEPEDELQEYMNALNKKSRVLKLAQPSFADLSDFSTDEQEYKGKGDSPKVAETQSRFLKKKHTSAEKKTLAAKANAPKPTERALPTDFHPTQSGMPASAALRRLEEIERRHKLRRSKVSISDNDSDLWTCKERPLSNRSSSDFSTRKTKFLKRKVNIKEPEPNKHKEKYVGWNQSRDTKKLALESEEEEILQLFGSSGDISEDGEQWWKKPKPPRTPSPPSKGTPRRNLHHSSSAKGLASPRRPTSQFLSRTPSPPSRGTPRFHRSRSLTHFRSRSPSPSARSSLSYSSPRARLWRRSQTSMSQRSDVKSLDELFSRMEDVSSAISNDFRLNILSLDDLAPSADRQEGSGRQKSVNEKPAKQDLLLSNGPSRTPLQKKSGKLFIKQKSTTDEESASEVQTESNESSEISENVSKDLSSSSSEHSVGRYDENTADSVYSEDFEHSLNTTTSDKDRKSETNYSHHSKSLHHKKRDGKVPMKEKAVQTSYLKFAKTANRSLAIHVLLACKLSMARYWRKSSEMLYTLFHTSIIDIYKFKDPLVNNIPEYPNRFTLPPYMFHITNVDSTPPTFFRLIRMSKKLSYTKERMNHLRRSEVSISENDSDLRTSEERPLSNRSSSDFSTRKTKFLKKKFNIKKRKQTNSKCKQDVGVFLFVRDAISLDGRHSTPCLDQVLEKSEPRMHKEGWNQSRDTKKLALENEEEEILQLVGSSVEISKDGEQWWKKPEKYEFAHERIHNTSNEMPHVCKKSTEDVLGIRSIYVGLPHISNTNFASKMYRKTPSPSARSSLSYSSPRARLGRCRQTSMSQRSYVRSLDELFSIMEDVSSASANDFRLNILSLEELSPSADRQEGSGWKSVNEKPAEQDLLLPNGHLLPNRTPLQKKSGKLFIKQKSTTDEESASEVQTESNESSEISEHVSKDLSSSSSEHSVGRYDNNTAESVYSEDFEHSFNTTTSDKDRKSDTNNSLHSKSLHHKKHNGKVPMKEKAVQTSEAGFTYYWPHGGSSFGHDAAPIYMEPVSIAGHVVSPEIIDALTSYNPMALALNDMLKQQVQRIQSFVDMARQQYLSTLSSLESEMYHYTTLEDTKEYIKNQKPLRFKQRLGGKSADIGHCSWRKSTVKNRG